MSLIVQLLGLVSATCGAVLHLGSSGDELRSDVADSTPQQDAADSSPQQWAIGASLGWSHTGIGFRHWWRPRWGSDLAGYANFGRRFGVYSLSTQVLYSMLRRSDFHFYAFAPLRWVYLREPTEYQSNFGPDERLRQVHKLRLGLGAGLEVRLGSYLAFVAEIPIAAQLAWVSVPNEIKQEIEPAKIMAAPNVAFYVYFR